MLKTRIITASILLPIVITLVYLGGAFSIGLSLFVFLVINFELFSFATNYKHQTKLQLTAISSIIPTSFLFYSWIGLASGIIIATIIMLTLNIFIHEKALHTTFFNENIPACFLGLAYTGVIGSCFVLASSQITPEKILWLVSIVVAADTLAYFGGKAVGGKKLSPRISPNKTIAGAVFGLIGATAASLTSAYFLKLNFEIPLLTLYGLLAGLLSILGDLAESLVKRIYQVKDSGTILPGHGGLLDRVDGLMFALVILFFTDFL